MRTLADIELINLALCPTLQRVAVEWCMGTSVLEAQYNYERIRRLVWSVPNLGHLEAVDLRVAAVPHDHFMTHLIPRPWAQTGQERRKRTREYRRITRVMKKLLQEVEGLLLQVNSLKTVTLKVYEWQSSSPDKVDVGLEHVTAVFPELQRKGMI